MDQTSSAVLPLPVETIDPITPSRAEDYAPISGRLWFRVAIIFLLLLSAVPIVNYGIHIRPQIYSNTDGLHWGDAYNAIQYGQGSIHYGLFHLYEPMYQAQRAGIDPLPDRTRTAMDYPPLRLMVVGAWARWAQRTNTANRLDYAGSGSNVIIPMLRLNTASELISSILVFLLIRMWCIRANLASGRQMPWWRGIPAGYIGALLMWFNPGLLWNSYAFPQWDTWIIPFFLSAVLMACVDWWFAAGLLIGMGAFLKGQMFIVAPLFIFWPLFQLKWDAAVRWLCGLAMISAAIALPFMEPSKAALIQFLFAVAALAMSIPFVIRLRLDYRLLLVCGAIAGALAWPWNSDASIGFRIVPLGLAGLVWLLRYVRPRIVPHLFALVVAVLVFMLMPLHHASDFWFQVGFKHGTEKFPIVATAGTNNLPAILIRYFQIGGTGEGQAETPVDVWLLGQMQIRTLMIGLYGACLVLCSFSAARHMRKSDPRFLLAMATPWICSFALLTQLNNRYIVWAAGMSALLPAVGVGMTLLGILISFLAWEGVAQLMYNKYDAGSEISRYLNPLQTNLGWLLALAAAVYLYVMLVPRPRLQTGKA